MKRTFALVSMAALVAMVGCKKAAELDDKILVDYIFQATMSGYSTAIPDTSQAGPTGEAYNSSIEYYMFGPKGGYCHVIGDMTTNVNVDEHGNFLNGSASFQITEVWNDFAFEDSSGRKFTLNGAPHISIVGLFTLWPDGAGGIKFGTASSIDHSGAVRATGPNGYDHTIDVLFTININSDGKGGDVSGTVDGKSINFTF